MEKVSTQARKGLLVINISAFLVPFMGSSLNLALPQIGEAFNMKAVTLTWMATAYLISTAIFQIPLAKIADIRGRRKVFIWGVFLFTLCTIASGLSTSGEMLIAMRFLSGIGAAMLMGTNMAILTALVPPSKRGKALGVNVSVVYAALAAGPFFGGIITQIFGWRGIFFVVAAVGLVILALSKSCLKGEWTEAKGEKFDLLGSIFYGIGLASLIFGFSNLPKTLGIVFLLTGLAFFVIFIVYERRQQFPVFNVRLFTRNRTFALSSFAALINYSATAAIAFMLSLYLQAVRGLEPSTAGLILISQAVVQSFFSIVVGNLSHKFSPSKMATTGMAIIVVGLIGLTFISPTTHFAYIMFLLMLLGTGFGVFSSPNTNVIMSSVEKKEYTQASAATGTMRLTGNAISMGIASMSISFFMGNEKIVPALFGEFLQSMRMAFMVFAVLCLIGVFASTARIEKKV
ncbi:MAG: MFS transporter [Fibrobacter sp.]|nr:MFS transporter [Fibrobacter sp.]